MAVSVTLAGGGDVVLYQTASGVFADLFDASLDPIALGLQISSAAANWINALALPTGGFLLDWVANGEIMAQAFSASGQAQGPAYPNDGALTLSAQGFSSGADGSTAYLPNGRYVTGASEPSAESNWQITLQQYALSGVPLGPAFTETSPPISLFTQPEIAPLTGGAYAAAFVQQSNYASQLLVERFDALGDALGQVTVATAAGLSEIVAPAIAGLADGGFAAAWEVVSSLGPNPPAPQVYVEAFNAQGQAVGGPVLLGSAAASSQAPVIDALPDGQYVVAWTSASGLQHEVITEQGPALGAANAPSPVETLLAAGAAVELSSSAGFTSVLAPFNGDLAVANATTNAYGGQDGAIQLYDASGDELASTPLRDFSNPGQTLTPELTALAGGFIQAGYAGSTDYEVYDSQGQQVFVHNVYSPVGQAFVPLLDGDYAVTTQGANAVGLVEADGQTAWVSIPADAPAAPVVEGLQGGGMAFTYPGSGQFDLFDPSGDHLAQGTLGASVSSFATAFAATAGGGFAEAWLSADGGQGGLPTSLDVQSFDASGTATSAVVTLTQDLDPWHSQLQLLANSDGSLSALWSEGGAISGAAVSGGAAGPAESAGLVGALSDFDIVQLPSDEVGFAFLQGGQAWGEIFNPATGLVERADLGAATGDLSTVHALATATGGLAVSWHEGSTVMASVLSAAGLASAPAAIGGDLLGVNANGQAVTVHDNGAGVPVLQTYVLNDGGFWTA